MGRNKLNRKKSNKIIWVLSIIFILVLSILIFLFVPKLLNKTETINTLETKTTEKFIFDYNKSIIVGYRDGGICKKAEYNTVVNSIEDNQKLICTINLESDYLFSWQVYNSGMENKVQEWLNSEECYKNFINWDIQENKKCGRQRQKDKIAVDEKQEDVFLICIQYKIDDFHYTWVKIKE